MQRSTFWLPVLVFGLGLALSLFSCEHAPMGMDEDITPIDTTGNNNPDTTGTDTTNMGTPCDPDVVYFEWDILPILRSNCALSGCHDEITHEEGVILTTYAKVMETGEVKAFNPGGSKLYRIITDGDSEDHIPPSPNQALSSSQISLINTWILQGAKNETCDPDAGLCNTENVSYVQDIQPVLQNNCRGCHSGNTPSGGILLDTHANVAAIANSGRMYGAISWQSGFVRMPLGAVNPLPQCTVDKIKAWIDAGAPNN